MFFLYSTLFSIKEEEKATIGELSDKIIKNKVATLDLADYTPAMRELHHILTGTLRYSMQRKKTTQPSFTDGYLKEGLRTSWTAQQIGHLLINYESEWYADEELSKWNEIDSLYEQEKQQKKEIIEQELNKLGLTLPYQRDFALKKLNEAHEHIKTNWQLEKEKRIKPSLWWKEVAEAQRANSNQAPVNANTPIISNLSMDGKAWFIHPVAMIEVYDNHELQFSAKGIAFLKLWEGLRLKPYDDQTGKTITQYTKGATIGVGHLIVSATEFEIYKNGIDQITAEKLLFNDLICL